MDGNSSLYKCKKCGQLIGKDSNVWEPETALEEIKNTGKYESEFNGTLNYAGQSHNSFLEFFPFLKITEENNQICKYIVSDHDKYLRSLKKYSDDGVVFSDYDNENCPVCSSNEFYRKLDVVERQGKETIFDHIDYETDPDITDNAFTEEKKSRLNALVEDENIQMITPSFNQIIKECQNSIDEFTEIVVSNESVDITSYIKQLLSIKLNEYSLEERLHSLLQLKLTTEQNILNITCKDKTVSNNNSLLVSQIDSDITNCTKTLSKAYQTEHDYLTPDIIFAKYTSLPALSTIYEYLITGRCTQLTGPDGAYNLYESELRTNLIIAKLDQISQKLDEVKENQYTLYKAVKSVNAQLSKLNDLAMSMNKELIQLNRTAKNIEENTSVIAYNTAATAYYSKINAELTNSLGFLIAIK